MADVGGGGGSSVGTSNEFQITDNAGGFLASLIQQDSDNIIPTTTAGVAGAGTKLGSATNYYAKLYLGGETLTAIPADCPTIYVQADCDFFIQKAGSTSTNNSLLWISRTTNGYVTSDRSFQTRNNGTQHFRIGNSGDMIFGASGTDKNYIQNSQTKFGFWQAKVGAILKAKSTFTSADFDDSVLLNLISTTQGFMQPSMTVAQRTAIASPIAGLQVHIEDGTDSIPYYNHSVDGWVPTGRYAGNPLTGAGQTDNQVQGVNLDGELVGLRVGLDTSSNVIPLSSSGAPANFGSSLGKVNVGWASVYASNFYGGSTSYSRYFFGSGGQMGALLGNTGTPNIGVRLTANSGSICFFKFCNGSSVDKQGLIISEGKNGLSNLGTGSEIDRSAILELQGKTKGFLPPRMTTAEMNLIPSPATGIMIYDETTNQWMGNNGTPAVPNWGNTRIIMGTIFTRLATGNSSLSVNGVTIKEIRDESDFPAAVGGEIDLVTNTTYVIIGIVSVTNLISIAAANIAILGSDREKDGLSYTGSAGAGDFITITDVNCEISNLKISSTNNTGGDVTLRAVNYNASDYNSGRDKVINNY